MGIGQRKGWCAQAQGMKEQPLSCVCCYNFPRASNKAKQGFASQLESMPLSSVELCIYQVKK